MVDVIFKVQPIKNNHYTFHSLSGSRSSWQLVSGIHAWVPPTDVFEKDDAIHVRVEIAGMRDGELEVTLDEHNLLIQGKRHSPTQDCAYHQLEIGYGKFRSGVKLPAAIKPDGVEASYQDGFLELLLPKKKARHIEVKER